jgi:hypothetical protein
MPPRSDVGIRMWQATRDRVAAVIAIGLSHEEGERASAAVPLPYSARSCSDACAETDEKDGIDSG